MNLAVDEIMEIILTNMCMLYDDKGRILVQKRTKKDWPGITFPGGHVEDGETVVESGIREMKEETGLDVYNLRVCGVKDWVIEGKRHLVILFKTNSFSGSLLPSKEGEVFWIKEEELTSYELAPDTHEIYLIMKNENVSELYIEGDRKKIM